VSISYNLCLRSSVELLDIGVEGALSLAHACVSPHSRIPCRAAGHVPLRRPLAGLDELHLLVERDRDMLYFTETWLFKSMPDSTFRLASFQLFGADQDTELSGGVRGGGVCFYSNSGWCRDQWLWLCSAVLRTWSPSSSTANPSTHCSGPSSLTGGWGPSGPRLHATKTAKSFNSYLTLTHISLKHIHL